MLSVKSPRSCDRPNRRAYSLLAPALHRASAAPGEVRPVVFPLPATELPTLPRDGERSLTADEVAAVAHAARRGITGRLRRLGHPDRHVDDICATTIERLIVKVIHHEAVFHYPRAVTAWLHRAVLFVAGEYHRGAFVMPRSSAHARRAGQSESEGGPTELPATGSNPEVIAAAKQELFLLAGLSAGDRELLRDAADGDRLGPASDLYRRRLHRARQRAHKLLAQAGRPAAQRRRSASRAVAGERLSEK